MIKKSIIVIFSCLFLVMCSSMVSAKEGFYGSIGVGASFLEDVTISGPGFGPTPGEAEMDTGFSLLGALGYDFGMFRLEGEVGYRTNDFDTGTIQGVAGSADLVGDQTALSFMGNVGIDIETQTKFTPYFLVGIGFAQVEADGVGIAGVAGTWDADDTVFAYQLGAGVGYAASETITLGLEYRYFGTSDPEDTIAGGNVEWEYATHNILLGIRFAF